MGYVVITRQNSPSLSKEKQSGRLDKPGSNFTLVHIANSQVQRFANVNAHTARQINERSGPG